MPAPDRVIARILANVDITADGCWVWTRRANTNGYGRIAWNTGGKECGGTTHRLMYEAFNGPIPDDLHVDHVCHDPATCHPERGIDCPHRRCCNPAHLQLATIRTNVLRGGGLTASNASKTHCPEGHPYDEGNTYVDARSGWRQCRTCRARRNAAA